MKNFKKAAAFTLAMALSLSCAASPAVFAVDDEDVISNSEEDIMPIMTDEDATPYVVGDTWSDEDNPDGLIPDEDEVEEIEILTSGIFSYYIKPDGTAALTDSTRCGDPEFTVPSELDGVKVTEIAASGLADILATKVTIPASIEVISDENPFARCPRLEEIIVEDGNKNYTAVDGILYTKDKKKLICYPAQKAGDDFNVPEGVESLGIAAIYETEIRHIVLPSTLTTMERHCLSFNGSLSKIDMSATQVETIGAMAFVECTILKEVTFSASTRGIGVGAFMNCSALAKVELPEALLEIGQNAFMGTAMLKIRVPEKVKNIGYCALGYDSDENPVEGFLIVGAQGSTAQSYAKDYDTEYDYKNDFDFVTIEEDDEAMEYASLDIINGEDFDYFLNDDGTATLCFCGSYDYTFSVPEEIDGHTITAIYKRAFATSMIHKLILPETVKTIGADAFSGNLESLTIPGGLTEIEGNDFFVFCTGLSEIIVTEGGDGLYSSEDGVLYSKDGEALVAYPAMKSDTEFVVPAKVTTIGPSAFCYNTILEKVELPNVELIYDYAFEGCSAIREVKLSKELNEVGVNAFMGCSSLKSIRLYDKLDTIGAYAFGYDYDEALASEIKQNEATYAANGMEVPMPYSVIEGFKIYAEEKTLGYEYAERNGIQVISGTIPIMGKNFDKNFLAVIGGGIGAIIFAILGIVTGKKISRKKKEKAAKKASDKRKAESAEKRSKKEDKAE